MLKVKENIRKFCKALTKNIETYNKKTGDQIKLCNDTINQLEESIGLFIDYKHEIEENSYRQITLLESELEKSKKIVKTDEEYYEKLLKENDSNFQDLKSKLNNFYSIIQESQQNFVSNLEIKIKYKMF